MTARLWPCAVLFAATATLAALPGDVTLAQTKAEKKAAKKAEKKAAVVTNQELNGQEAELLRQAYLLMNAANGNYAGHKAKAMEQVREACLILDKAVLDRGTKAQEVESLRQDAVTAYAKTRRAGAGKVIEPQVVSDAQLYQAGQLLTQVRAAAAKRGQPRILGHVDNALAQIELALKTR